MTIQETISMLASAWLSGSSGACHTAIFITCDPRNPPVWDNDELNGLPEQRGSKVQNQDWDSETLMSMDVGAMSIEIWNINTSRTRAGVPVGKPECREKHVCPLRYPYEGGDLVDLLLMSMGMGGSTVFAAIYPRYISQRMYDVSVLCTRYREGYIRSQSAYSHPDTREFEFVVVNIISSAETEQP